MNNGDTQHTSVLNKSRSRLWFGTGLTQFLKTELRDFPGRRVAAFRLFIVCADHCPSQPSPARAPVGGDRTADLLELRRVCEFRSIAGVRDTPAGVYHRHHLGVGIYADVCRQ